MSAGSIKVDTALAEASKARPTLEDMERLARDEACRIETVQSGLIDCGARAEPDADQIRRLVGWNSIERLVGLFAKHEDRARTFFRDLENQGRRG